ncbi:MAG TPA: hypothetical protein VF516_03215 [Kofleriaceae bacterium]
MSEFTGFVGQAYEAASRTQNDQALINWYPETDPTKFGGSPSTGAPEQRGVIALYPTPGLISRLQLQYGQVRGFHTIPGGQLLFAVCGNALYSITTAYVATNVGTLNSNSGRVYITDNGVSAYITDGNNRYTYNWTTGAFAVVAATDGAFVGGNVCGVVDNFIFYNRPGTNQFGCTNVGDVVSGNLNFGSKIGGPDNIVSVFADHRQVLLLGEKESERWINVGSFPFPFAVIPGASMQHGLHAQDSVARLGEGVAFLAQDDRGTATVVMWGATLPSPQRISTFAIESAIQSYAVTADAIGYSYAQGGHEFYVLTFPTADVTWCYDISTQMWHRRAWRDSQNVYHRHRSNCAVSFNGETLVGDWQNGKVYALSLTKFTDDGDPLPCVRRAPHLTNDLRRQFFSDLQIQFQPGIGLQTGQGSDPTCILRWSNDGGFTFGNDHTIKMGKAGEYRRRAMKRRLGWARDRVYEIEVTDPVFRVVVSANITASAGAN